MRFMQLTYYVHNKTFPRQSHNTGKKFWLRVEHIEELTPYDPDGMNPNRCTKITMQGGRTIEVVEEADAIIQTLLKIVHDEAVISRSQEPPLF